MQENKKTEITDLTEIELMVLQKEHYSKMMENQKILKMIEQECDRRIENFLKLNQVT